MVWYYLESPRKFEAYLMKKKKTASFLTREGDRSPKLQLRRETLRISVTAASGYTPPASCYGTCDDSCDTVCLDPTI